jgi:DNA-binding beta-propeller fold protein YncE
MGGDPASDDQPAEPGTGARAGMRFRGGWIHPATPAPSTTTGLSGASRFPGGLLHGRVVCQQRRVTSAGPRSDSCWYSRQIDDPAGLAVGDGSVFVTSRRDGRILRLDGATLTTTEKIGTQGSGPGQLLKPTGIAVANGFAYVGDTGNHRISKWSVGAP